jgi:geranylgeranyl diphosphate synthase type II
VKQTEEVILGYLPKEEGYQKTVIEAMNYSMLAGGKRLRPLLLWETYKAFGGQDKGLVEPFMAAIEMIHTYSLVHDDLPAMDDDEYRRGKKTTHVQYGEAMGILAGDGLLNYAFETALKAFDSEENKMRALEALKLLAKKPGIYGMLGGQAVDVEDCGQMAEEDKLLFMYELKTSALIECSLMMGGILAGVGMEEVEKLEKLGKALGLAFQIQDDILDVTSTVEVLGKPIHSDEKNQKTTIVTLKGLEGAKKAVEDYSLKALTLLKSLPADTGFLEQLMVWLMKREK